MATQKEVADRAGVSFITVSRVINKLGNVKEETRLRVEEAIRELNYHPNSLGQALNTGRTSIIGVVTPMRITGNFESNIYLIGLLDGIERSCRTRRLDLLLSTETNEREHFDLLRPYNQRKVDGLIFVGLRKVPEEVLEAIEKHDIPSVVISDRPDLEHLSWVDTDNFEAGKDAIRRFYEQGKRRIAFAVNEPELHPNRNVQDRFAGAIAACKELGLEINEQLIYRGALGETLGNEAILRFQTLSELPDAIFCANDDAAMAILRWALKRGVRVPQDLALIGFDAIPVGQWSTPSLATYRQPLSDMGFAAAEILAMKIHDRAMPRSCQTFKLSFVPGPTLAVPVS